MNLGEGKALLEELQKLVVSHRAHEYLGQHRDCPCGNGAPAKMREALR